MAGGVGGSDISVLETSEGPTLKGTGLQEFCALRKPPNVTDLWFPR